MNFQKLNINSNNFHNEKYLDLLIQKGIQNTEEINIESSYYKKISADYKLTSYNPSNIFDYNYHNNNTNQFEYTRSNIVKENGSKLLNTGFQSKDNLLLKKRKRKKRGKPRKLKKNENLNYIHTKFSKDNLQRKCKNLVLDCILEYVNYQINKIYEGNIGNGIHIKKLFDISQEQKAQNTVNHINKLKDKTIKEIFSTIISKRYTSYLPNHNEIIINRVLNEKNKKKRKKFIKLFNLTFLDCIRIFLGNNTSEDYEGFPIFDNIKDKFDETNEYINKIKECLIKLGKKCEKED